jgi:hypothetical protein
MSQFPPHILKSCHASNSSAAWLSCKCYLLTAPNATTECILVEKLLRSQASIRVVNSVNWSEKDLIHWLPFATGIAADNPSVNSEVP